MIPIARAAAMPVTAQAMPAAAFLLIRPLSSTPLSSAPRRGRTGMSQTRSFMVDPLPAELRGLVELRGLAQAEQGDQDAQAHGGLARGDGNREDRENLTGQVGELVGERD